MVQADKFSSKERLQNNRENLTLWVFGAGTHNMGTLVMSCHTQSPRADSPDPPVVVWSSWQRP